jgi:hypothetical protein
MGKRGVDNLLLVALVLICIMVHVWWPDHPTPTSRTPLKPDRGRRRTVDTSGLTDHVWSLREVLLFRVPLWLQPQVV